MPNDLRSDTVEALLDTVRDFLRAEDERGQGLITRGSGVATFAGLIVSVLGVLGTQILDQPVDSTAKEAAALTFIAAFTLLILTVAIALWGLLWPRSYDTISMEEIARYPYPEFVFAERVMVQGRTMRGLIEGLASERKRNARKAFWLKWAYSTLSLGLVAVAVSALILTAEGANVLWAG